MILVTINCMRTHISGGNATTQDVSIFTENFNHRCPLIECMVPHSVKHLVHVASGVDILIMSVCQTSCESKIIITSLVPRLHMKHISHGDWLSVLCRLHQTELTIVSSNLSDQTISGQIVYVSGQISECPYILLCPPRVHNIIIVIRVMSSCTHASTHSENSYCYGMYSVLQHYCNIQSAWC